MKRNLMRRGNPGERIALVEIKASTDGGNVFDTLSISLKQNRYAVVGKAKSTDHNFGPPVTVINKTWIGCMQELANIIGVRGNILMPRERPLEALERMKKSGYFEK